MNPEDPKDEQPAPSREGYTNDSSKNTYYERYHLMCAKIEKLLQEDCFDKGLSLTDDEINLSISMLGKNINIFNSNLEYKGFF